MCNSYSRMIKDTSNNPLHNVLKGIGLSVALALAPIQYVQADSEVFGPASTTAYSGKKVSVKNVLTRPVSANAALYSVQMGERSDDPCYLRAQFRNINSGSESTRTYDECSGNERSLKTARLPSNAYVTGARVCLNSARDKVKGLELKYSYDSCMQGEAVHLVGVEDCSSVYDFGSHDYRMCNTGSTPSYRELSCSTSRSVSFERTNCPGSDRGPDSDWEKTVNCPKDHIATGVSLNTREGGGSRRMISGLALVCHRLRDTSGSRS